MIVEYARFFLSDMPTALEQLAASMGPLFYVILFAIIFAETGLVVTPFLPGDSLLFAAGAVCALPGAGLNVFLLGGILICAALLGDLTNYSVGRFVAKKFMLTEKVPFIRQEHLLRTTLFFERHGGKTIVLARFLPILRTYAPFVAGAAGMSPSRYAIFCLSGALTWIPFFLGLGFAFGNQPSIRSNFKYVILAIIVISLMPAVAQWVASWNRSRKMDRSQGTRASRASKEAV